MLAELQNLRRLEHLFVAHCAAYYGTGAAL